MIDIFTNYTQWLISKVSTPDASKYSFLLTELNKIEYYWAAPSDRNRQREGLELREEFVANYNDDSIYAVMPDSCTALELLISLARRADFVMYDNADGERVAQWFWLFIKNLGLDYLTNDMWTFEASTYIYTVITKWFDKRYSPSGVGSPFPNPYARTDLTKVPMWDMLQWYLADNFDTM